MSKETKAVEEQPTTNINAEADRIKELEAQLEKQSETIQNYELNERNNKIDTIGIKVFGNDNKVGYNKFKKYISFGQDFDYTNEKLIEAKMQEVKNDLVASQHDASEVSQQNGTPTKVSNEEDIKYTIESGIK